MDAQVVAAGTIVSTDVNNSIIAGSDGGAFYTDPDDDNTNEIQNLTQVLTQGADANATVITNLADPLVAQDAATKAYVDAQVVAAGTIVSADVNNSIIAGSDGGAFYTDPDNDATNEIQNLTQVLTQGADAGATVITNLADPLVAQDAATKAYVDAAAAVHTGTTGSVFFADSSTGAPTENNAQLFWDDSNLKLFLGPQIATASDVKLNVNGTTRTQGIKNSDGTTSLPSYRFTNDLNSGMFLPSNNQLAFSTGSTEAIRIDAGQNVGIGFTNPSERLDVNGDIRAEFNFISGITQLLVPDYVFDIYFDHHSEINKDYRFKTLIEIEDFIRKYHHLPGIKSAREIQKEGVWNITEATTNNLEKIEELFLHTIEQEKKIKSLEAENEDLNNKMLELGSQLKEIKELISKEKS